MGKMIQVDGSMVDEDSIAVRAWRIHGMTGKGVVVTFLVDARSESKALREAGKRCILENMTAVEA